MAIKGALAKKYITDQLKLSFGSKYLGESGGKVYLSVPDGSEMVQIAISMTCAKTPISLSNEETPSAWEMKSTPMTSSPSADIEITDTEKQHIADLLEKLGL